MGIEAHTSPTFCVTHATLLMHILRRMHIFINKFGQLDVSLSQIQQSPPHVQLMHIFGHMDVHCTLYIVHCVQSSHTYWPFPMIISVFPATLARVPPNFWWDPTSLGASKGSVVSIL